jgi:hypothetical protein
VISTGSSVGLGVAVGVGVIVGLVVAVGRIVVGATAGVVVPAAVASGVPSAAATRVAVCSGCGVFVLRPGVLAGGVLAPRALQASPASIQAMTIGSIVRFNC